MKGAAQSAWQWLIPPELELVDGALRPRSRRRAKPVAGDALPLEAAVPQAVPVEQPLQPELARGPAQLLAHPQANQHTLLAGQSLHYRLQRSQRRSIGFSVGPQGLVVSAPAWLDLAAVDQSLQTKAGWIVQKLMQAAARHEESLAARIRWEHGGEIGYMGRPMRLCMAQAEPGGRAPRIAYREQALDGRQFLYLPLTQQAAPTEVKACVQAWMLREARAWFTARLQHHAQPMGVQWTGLRLSNASTRWGSANSSGLIRLNWRLIQHGPQVIDYVVVHELAHLRHMDHSPRFWAVVAEQLPDWKQQRKILKEHVLPPWE